MNMFIYILLSVIAILFIVIIGFLKDLKVYLAEKFKQKSFAQAEIMRTFDRKNHDLLVDNLSLKLKYAIEKAEEDKEQWISKRDFVETLKLLRTELKKELNSSSDRT